MLVGDDALGGFFALDGGGIAEGSAHIFHLAPDTLAWEEVATSCSEWLRSLMNGDLATWYEGSRWSGWQRDARGLQGDRAFSIAPPLWAQGPTIDERSRRAVPLGELWELHVRVWPKQLGR